MKNLKAKLKNLVALLVLALVVAGAGLLNRYGKTYVEGVGVVEPSPEQDAGR